LLGGAQAPPSLLAADIAKGRLEGFTRTRLNQYVDALGATSDRELAAKSLLKLMFTAASGERTHRAIRDSIGKRDGRTADFIRREEDRVLAELASEFVADSHSREPELAHEPAPLLISLALREVSDCAKAIIELYDRYSHSGDTSLYLYRRRLSNFGEPPVPEDAAACFRRLEAVIRAYAAIRDSLYMRKGSPAAGMVYRLDHVINPAVPEATTQPRSAGLRFYEVLAPLSHLPSDGPYVPDVWLAWWTLRFTMLGVITLDDSTVGRIYSRASELACLAASINEAALEQRLADDPGLSLLPRIS